MIKIEQDIFVEINWKYDKKKCDPYIWSIGDYFLDKADIRILMETMGIMGRLQLGYFGVVNVYIRKANHLKVSRVDPS